MNEVTLVKVTLNEATDPDLFAFIMRYDNPRLRAGALRALARAALLNSAGHAEPGSSRVAMQTRAETMRPSRQQNVGAARSDQKVDSPALQQAHALTTQEPAPALTQVQEFNRSMMFDELL